RLLIVLLALGTFGGYASGFASMARHHRYRCHGGGWDQRWDSRWDSRGPRQSWDSHGPRGAAPPAAAPATPEAPASPAEPR
ncbi:MAG TPA: hypothetical protein VE153_11775, partial [Myxococcus sp.]|nr:hypothetical protein [Myxococcus sp.]